jgi:hypothetical protein
MAFGNDWPDWRRMTTVPSQLGPFRLDSWALPHFVPNAGVRFSAGDLTVAYTGDSGPDAALVELARDADRGHGGGSGATPQPGRSAVVIVKGRCGSE